MGFSMKISPSFPHEIPMNSNWWLSHPLEKYESQIGSSSQLLGKKMFQTTNQN
jgi:hypothetical protein